MSELNYQNLCQSIKSIIRRNGMTYEELSKKIKVPVSTLKKQLNAEDGSFNKLTRICKGLGVALGDVLQMEKKEPAKKIKFSETQQRAFSQDRELFAFYWRLVFERKKASSIKRMMKLKDGEFKKILLTLDKLGLIRLEKDDQLVIPPVDYVQWRPEDRFSKSLFKEWAMKVVLDGIGGSKNQSDKHQFVLQHFQLTPESQQDLMNRIVELDEEFARRTIQELKLYPAKVKSIRSLYANCEGSFISNSPIL